MARIVALLAPWIVVLAVLAAAQHTTGDTVRTTADRDGAATTLASDAATASATIPAGAPSDMAGEGSSVPAPADVPATAVRLVRDAVTGRHAGATTAIDVAVPEAPRSLGADQWLVRVHAVVLRGDTRRWRSATHEVWAVPLGMSGEQVVSLDTPWPVATTRPRVARGRWTSEVVDQKAVRTALREAGLRPAGNLAAERHPQVPYIIRVRTAGAQGRHVWLRTAPTMQVLGTRGSEAVE
jgi:hypothetical protein